MRSSKWTTIKGSKIRYTDNTWTSQALENIISWWNNIFQGLTCSSVVCISSCRALYCCSLRALHGFPIGTYDCTELGSTEGSAEGKEETYLFVHWFLLLFAWFIWWVDHYKPIHFLNVVYSPVFDLFDGWIIINLSFCSLVFTFMW